MGKSHDYRNLPLLWAYMHNHKLSDANRHFICEGETKADLCFKEIYRFFVTIIIILFSLCKLYFYQFDTTL